MKVDFLRLPGNGQKQIDFPGQQTVTLRQVLEEAKRAYGHDCMINNEIACNGETVDKVRWDAHQVFAGDLISATGVVKGALWHTLNS
jgi:hypothetical protein